MPEERRIAAEMRSVGRSIEEIAEELNRDHSTVWRWLNKDDATEAYLRVLGEQRRQCWLTLAQVATEQALQVVVDAVSSGDQKIAVKWLEILTRDEVGRDRLWSEP